MLIVSKIPATVKIGAKGMRAFPPIYMIPFLDVRYSKPKFALKSIAIRCVLRPSAINLVVLDATDCVATSDNENTKEGPSPFAR